MFNVQKIYEKYDMRLIRPLVSTLLFWSLTTTIAAAQIEQGKVEQNETNTTKFRLKRPTEVNAESTPATQADPNNLCVRYGLGWAYYMQAYLYGEEAKKQEKAKTQNPYEPYKKKSKLNSNLLAGAGILASVITGTKPPASAIPHIPGALEGTPVWAQEQIRAYYKKSLDMLAEVIKRDAKDPWAQVYRVHVQEEYDGNNSSALSQLSALKNKFPNNPAVEFFLADAQARNGNFAAGASSLGRAVQLKLEGK
ncbi:MAG: hypothetical protein IPL73_05685 [Candidatus Obscuribacter sp.]|nr:hypothetical protein [Candidatus Obscuribacter sp.]